MVALTETCYEVEVQSVEEIKTLNYMLLLYRTKLLYFYIYGKIILRRFFTSTSFKTQLIVNRVAFQKKNKTLQSRQLIVMITDCECGKHFNTDKIF